MPVNASKSRWPILAALLVLGVVAFFFLRKPGEAPSKKPRGASSGASSSNHERSTPEGLEPATVPSFELVAPDAAPPPSGLRSEVPWGPNGLGKGTSEDGYPGGPNSFTVGPDGSTWVLDQFNKRMVRVGPDGKILETRPTKLESPADIALGKDGSMAVIDRTRQNQVELFDAQGRSKGILPLPGSVAGQPSELTRVFVEKDKVYAQRGEGGPLLPVGGIDGRPETGKEINGQPSRDGKLLISAGVTNFDQGRVWIGGADPATQGHVFTREANLGNELEQILLLDSDLTGMIYLVVKATFDNEGAASTLVLCADGNARGQITRMFSLPYPHDPLDTFRKFDVDPQGGLLAAEYTETGVAYRMHSCR